MHRIDARATVAESAISGNFKNFPEISVFYAQDSHFVSPSLLRFMACATFPHTDELSVNATLGITPFSRSRRRKRNSKERRLCIAHV